METYGPEITKRQIMYRKGYRFELNCTNGYMESLYVKGLMDLASFYDKHPGFHFNLIGLDQFKSDLVE